MWWLRGRVVEWSDRWVYRFMGGRMDGRKEGEAVKKEREVEGEEE